VDVFNALGKMVLDNAWEGYHCCLFAYGQTGSGKSFSMVGYGKNKGIVPISMNEIFERVKSQQTETKSFEVCASIIEIYNEKVQDLLIDPRTRPAGGLKVRESKTLGVYVQDMTKHPVTSYAQIEKLMDEGYENRSVGSTQMNATSSRAHTIITIEIKQVIFEGGRKSEKFSVINLVDLAGSEKAGQTGATGDRLKEGCAINKSLTVLG
jgi:kinesin family member 13